MQEKIIQLIFFLVGLSILVDLYTADDKGGLGGWDHSPHGNIGYENLY